MKALIARKIGMTSTIAEDGVVAAVTLLSVQPNVVSQVKTTEADGYTAVQMATEDGQKLGKAASGHFKPAKIMPALIREFRITDEDLAELNVGSQIKADVFSVGDEVDVVGTSKGKGFAGTIKRHNFHRQRKTHGGKGNTRKPGSIGSMYPQHILKGKKMAGQLGHVRVTTKNLRIALVDADQGIIGVTGAVPGPRKSVVILKGVK